MAFMNTSAPNGQRWADYCREEAPVSVSRRLQGRWAECIAWASYFELTNDWSRMPEYQPHGPVGGVIEALKGATMGMDRKWAEEVQAAALNLEDGCRKEAERGRELPIIKRRLR
eukprot:TRINITY_DN24142_c0_g1_i1.p1 TRINITY_DN24142_c0_g1~~TRINITY_DN24142_c0_g1_i1.p1  ORF type:complete len:130 (-),score=18.63 TRINITY_DN24142_c0_g1_i1:31-372(-)